MTSEFIDKIDGVRVQMEAIAKSARNRDEATLAANLANDIYQVVREHYAGLRWGPEPEFLPYGVYRDEMRVR